ncbi:hypothetical protein [Pseudoxanthomonas sp. J35]|uniref:hypothetical protein n=1 Tax=Pseudoxanthomonas sp. J35 TaxID=935852 RepID=UPI00048AAACE|nr:hypothetical protein [Pseudoxanthomonas sp. J35]
MHTAESLQAEVAAIQAALAGERLAELPSMLQAHDAHLRSYCRGVDVEAQRPALERLQALHWELLAQMRQRQQELLAAMRQQRRSGRVARAYAHAGEA